LKFLTEETGNDQGVVAHYIIAMCKGEMLGNENLTATLALQRRRRFGYQNVRISFATLALRTTMPVRVAKFSNIDRELSTFGKYNFKKKIIIWHRIHASASAWQKKKIHESALWWPMELTCKMKLKIIATGDGRWGVFGYLGI